MRKDSQFALVLVTTLVLTGCASTFNSATPKGNGASAMLSSGNRDRFGNTQRTGWDKFSHSVAESSVGRGVRSAFSGGKTNTVPTRANVVPASDPTSLAAKAVKPSVAMHVSMANLLDQAGRTDEAIDHLQKALAIEPNNLDAILANGHFLDRKGQFQAALAQYEMACYHHPQASKAFNDLGLCLARMQRLDDSVVPLSRAIELDPQRKLYRNNIATILAERGRLDEALGHLRAVHGDAVAHYNLGHLLKRRGDTQAASQFFARAASFDPNFVAARHWANQLAATAPTSMPVSYQTVPSDHALLVGQRYQTAPASRPVVR